MDKFIPILLLTISIAVIQINSLSLESNPWVKIDHYLRDNEKSTDPIKNLNLAENFLQNEKSSQTKLIKTNEKLIAALELFVEMKKLVQNKDLSLACDTSGHKIFKSIKVNIEGGTHLHGLDHLINVYGQILKLNREICRNRYYKILSNKFNESNVDDIIDPVDIFLENFIYVRTNATKLENKKTFAGSLYDNIIDQHDLKIDEIDLESIYKKCYESYGLSLEQLFKHCVINPCKNFNQKFDDSFDSADFKSLKPVESNSEEGNNFYLYWAKSKICNALVKKGAKKLYEDLFLRPLSLYGNFDSLDNYSYSGLSSGNGALFTAMG